MRKNLLLFCIYLPILAFFNPAFADKKDNNIICYAAKSKWVCAPESERHTAQEKAQLLLEHQEPEPEQSTEVIIKTVSLPSFTQPGEAKQTLDSFSSESTKKTKPYDSLEKFWSYQLIGLSSSQSAVKFVKANQLNKNNILIIKSTRANMDWWIVLYGLYGSRDIGKNDKSNLPINIKNAWLRPLKSLTINGYIDDF